MIIAFEILLTAILVYDYYLYKISWKQRNTIWEILPLTYCLLRLLD